MRLLKFATLSTLTLVIALGYGVFDRLDVLHGEVKSVLDYVIVANHSITNGVTSQDDRLRIAESFRVINENERLHRAISIRDTWLFTMYSIVTKDHPEVAFTNGFIPWKIYDYK